MQRACVLLAMAFVLRLSTSGAGPAAAPEQPPERSRSSKTTPSPEKAAMAKLSLARSYRMNDMSTQAVRILRSIVEQYPHTEAAVRARRWIQDIRHHQTNGPAGRS